MEEKERDAFKIKLILFGLAIFLVFSLLISRLWTLQIAEGSEYAAKAKGNTMRYLSIPATRGDIVDSKGKVLATSQPQFAVTLDWLDMQNSQGDTSAKQIVKNLAKYIQPYWGTGNVSIDNISEDILAKIQMHQFKRYEPVVVLEKIPLALQAVLAEHQQELPGVSVEARPFRTYPYTNMGGQMLGYLREVSEGELNSFQTKAKQAGLDKDLYQQGDLVGKMGIENSYDMYLRGQDGIQLMEVDNKARPVDRLTRQEPSVGRSVQMTIDLDMQKAIDDKFTEVVNQLREDGSPKAGEGAAVVIEVKTGKILAMVSRPDMNPNDLIGELSDDISKQYFGKKSEGSPRLGWSRAFQEIYYPGSTFKMITGMSALQDGVVKPNQVFADRLSTLRGQGIAEWNDGVGFGPVNLFSGLAHSSNIYFQKLGELLFDHNPERLGQVAREFGLGRKSGVDLLGESEGTAPSPEWKRALKEPYFNKVRDIRLKALQDKWDPQLAAASSEKERKKLQAQYQSEKNQLLAEWNIEYKYEVGWQQSDTYNTAMGQGDNKYTMLQMANYVATIANGGNHMKPYLVDRVYDTSTKTTIMQNQPTVLNKVSISPENIDYIKQAMQAVVTPPGTASGVFRSIPQFTGGAKTGTAQQGSKDTEGGSEFYGTFVAFAPYDNPEIAFAGVVEYGKHGGTSAGELCKAAFLQYFKDKGWAEKK
jgi:penicillin-binding protein 2